MALIYDLVTAQNLKGFWDTRQEEALPTLGEKAFPAKKQLGLKLLSRIEYVSRLFRRLLRLYHH